MLESSGSSSESDDWDSNISGSATSLCSFYSKSLVGFVELKN